MNLKSQFSLYLKTEGGSTTREKLKTRRDRLNRK